MSAAQAQALFAEIESFLWEQASADRGFEVN